jgi:hypothetical protein
MHRWLLVGLLGLIALSPPPGALAQDSEEIFVTAARISSNDYSGMPAITLARQADFLAKSIELTNDTRDHAGRANEIYQTIKDLVEATKGQSDFALAYGSDFLIPITDANYTVVPLTEDSDRPDTTNVTIYAKAALAPGANVEQLIAKLTTFITDAKVTGRTEVTAGDSVSLSLVSPEKYRPEIIKRIVDDAGQLRATVGPSCKINISGLENRVEWGRTDISELTLYIPYKVEMTDCG